MQKSLEYWFETSLYRYPPQKIIKFESYKKIIADIQDINLRKLLCAD